MASIFFDLEKCHFNV